MALREFADAGGRQWVAWEVRPTPSEGLAIQIGSNAPSSPRPAWLAFECRMPPERRRLSPFPPDWADLPDVDLERLCAEAEQAPARRRLIE